MFMQFVKRMLRFPKIHIVSSTDGNFIKFMSFLNETLSREYLIIGTHSGTFHADEVLACAMLALSGSYKEIWVVRTRDPEILSKCHIIVDVGGGEYDHHSRPRHRSSGGIYASSGLVWRDFHTLILSRIKKDYFNKKEINLQEVYEGFDSETVKVVDFEDNGVLCDKKNIFSFIPIFNPQVKDPKEKDYNLEFLWVLLPTIAVLERALIAYMAKVYTRKIVWERYNNPKTFHKNILEIPSQNCDWLETVLEINAKATDESKKVYFVIFPYPIGGWAAQCVPPSLEEKYNKLIPFPKEWAGLSVEDLRTISNVATAIFCHLGCFFVRAEKKADIIKICRIAANQYKAA